MFKLNCSIYKIKLHVGSSLTYRSKSMTTFDSLWIFGRYFSFSGNKGNNRHGNRQKNLYRIAYIFFLLIGPRPDL